MRLTLRTMLAYLDDVLEPADSADIGKKIEESEFASNIVHKTRDVMRRLRLGAPKLSGRGMGLDPNTVAEYLDNTLPEERIADFEKVCLESDVHLAEVASCHQILALVLDQPADVDPASRQHMYVLPERAEKMAAAAAAAATTASQSSGDLPLAPAEHAEPVPAAARVERRKPEVPEYLRETAEEGSWWSAVAIAALAVAFIAVLVMAIGVDEGSWLGQKLGFGRGNMVPNEVAQAPAEAGDGTTGDDSSKAAPTDDGEPPATAEGTLKQPDTVAVPPRSDGDSTEKPEPPVPNDTAATAAAAAAAATTSKGADAGDAPAIIKPGTTAKTVDPDAATPAQPAATEKTADAVPATPPGEASPKTAEGPAESVGRLVSKGQVLLRLDGASGNWQRLPPLQTLYSGDVLTSLPAFRSSLTLNNGISLELLGDTVVAIVTSGGDGIPLLHIERGRVVVLPAGKADTQLRISVGQRQAMMTFVDSSSTVAFEVLPMNRDGVNPETEPSPLMIEMYAASGKLTWQDLPAGKAEEVAAPIRVSLGAKGLAPTELPEWITQEKLTNSEKIGAEFMAEYLAADRPTMLGLAELAEHRRSEVRALALSCLTSLAKYEPVVTALNQSDPAQRNLWEQLVLDLRAAIARGPEHAAAVRAAFEKHRGESAKELYRMLWGYTPEQLKEGADAKLVEYLDHSDMDFRSLAIWNLHHITGMTLNYRPDYNADLRKSHVQKWKQRLTSGQIVFKE